MQAQLEKAAWFVPWTVQKQVEANVGKALYDAFDWYTLPEGDYDRARLEVMKLVQTAWLDLPSAIKTVIDKYIKKTPEYAKKNKSGGWGGASKPTYKTVIVTWADGKPHTMEYVPWDSTYSRDLGATSLAVNPNTDKNGDGTIDSLDIPEE